MNFLIFIIFISAIIATIVLLTRSNLSTKLQKAKEYFSEQDYSKANELVKSILAKKKDYVGAIFLRARILYIQKQYLMAISELQNILSITDYKRYENESEIRLMLAELYHETQAWDKEINEYKILIKFNPDHIIANYRLGQALYTRKKYKDAKIYLERALDLDSSLEDIPFMLGICTYEVSQYYEAEELLLKARKIPLYELDASYYLGLVYKQREDFEKAVEMLERARASSKYNVQSLYELGDIYYQKSKHEKAIKILEKGLGKLGEKNKDTIPYRYLLATCYEYENKIEQAIEQLEKITIIDRNYEDAKIKLENLNGVLKNDNLKFVYELTPEKLQNLLLEIITEMNYNVITKEITSKNEFTFKTFNVKRINEPQILIYFVRTTNIIDEEEIIRFYKKITTESCSKGVYMTTSAFDSKAELAASTRVIEPINFEFIGNIIQKIRSRSSQ